MTRNDHLRARDIYAAAARRQIEIARAGTLPPYGWPLARRDRIAMRNLAWWQIQQANICWRRAQGMAA